jgi:hypothetical protein
MTPVKIDLYLWQVANLSLTGGNRQDVILSYCAKQAGYFLGPNGKFQIDSVDHNFVVMTLVVRAKKRLYSVDPNL